MTSQDIPTPSDPNPLAVVTGASSGIGLSLARQFLDHGFDVVVAAEDDGIHAAAAELAGSGRSVDPVQADLSTPEGVEGLAAHVADLGRPVEAAAINAGVGVGGRFVDTELEDDLRLVDLNVRSTVHLTKLLVRPMVQRGQGRVLVTASIAATAPGPFHATYAASKAFVHSFAEGIRYELKDTGVSVTSLMPGPTDTDFFDRADMNDTKVGQGSKDDPDEVAKDGFDALMSGRASVVAGSFSNRVQAEVSTHLPDTVAAAAQSRMTAPGSGHDDDKNESA
jgi:short-subunit dehydrogenase